MKKQRGVQKSILLEAGKDLEFGIPEIPGEKKKHGMRAVRVLIRTILREEWSQPFCRSAGCGGICLVQLLCLPRWAQHLPLALPGCSCSSSAFCDPPRGSQLSHSTATVPDFKIPGMEVPGRILEDSHVIRRHGQVSAHHRALITSMCMNCLLCLLHFFFLSVKIVLFIL